MTFSNKHQLINIIQYYLNNFVAYWWGGDESQNLVQCYNKKHCSIYNCSLCDILTPGRSHCVKSWVNNSETLWGARGGNCALHSLWLHHCTTLTVTTLHILLVDCTVRCYSPLCQTTPTNTTDHHYINHNYTIIHLLHPFISASHTCTLKTGFLLEIGAKYKCQILA